MRLDPGKTAHESQPACGLQVVGERNREMIVCLDPASCDPFRPPRAACRGFRARRAPGVSGPLAQAWGGCGARIGRWRTARTAARARSGPARGRPHAGQRGKRGNPCPVERDVGQRIRAGNYQCRASGCRRRRARPTGLPACPLARAGVARSGSSDGRRSGGRRAPGAPVAFPGAGAGGAPVRARPGALSSG